MKPRTVGLAVTEGAPVFELAIPCEIFGRYRDSLPEPWYELRVCAPAELPAMVSNGFAASRADGYQAQPAPNGPVAIATVRDPTECLPCSPRARSPEEH